MQPVPRVPPLDRPATYEDLVKLPEHMVAEILDGELHASPRPAPRHARAGVSVGAMLAPPFDHGLGGPGGWWILAEPELHLATDVVVPDLAGWRRTRMPRLPDTAYVALPPDWLCEILSPSTASVDRTTKLAIYARERVASVWLIDPHVRTLEVLQWEGGRWTLVATHAGVEVVRVVPFSDIKLDLSLIWAESPPAGG
jgi:Uma2 family endonuclease